MKHLVLLGDGMADFPLEGLGGKTPLEAAKTPAMDQAVREGLSGLFCPIPDGFAPGSDIGNLSVFGYDPSESFTGRAPLEAANQGIVQAENEVIFRCNLVTLEDGLMRDFTADHITSEEGGHLLASLNEAVADDSIRFAPGVSYRNLCLIRCSEAEREWYCALACTPPHDITDRQYAPYLPQGEFNSPILSLLKTAEAIFPDHPINVERQRTGKLPATGIWMWGQGVAPSLTPYEQQFGISGAVISAVDLVNGIGHCAGFEVVRVTGATGYLDTNYEGKVEAALQALERHDFTYLHVEAPDEAAHEGDAALKIRAIEDFDARVVALCLEAARSRDDLRVLIAPDHVTSIDTRTHAMGAVPFVLTGPGIVHNGLSAYHEAEAARAGILFPKGHELTQAMIMRKEISAGGMA